MKYSSLHFFILCCILLSVSSCKTISDFTKVDVSFNQNVTVPEIPAIALNFPVTYTTPSIDTQVDSICNVYHVTTDLIDKVYLKTMSITVVAPDSVDLGFLKSITVYIKPESGSNIKIASAANAGSSSILNLNVENVNLKKYLTQDTFALYIIFIANKATTEPIEVRADMAATMDLKILGL